MKNLKFLIFPVGGSRSQGSKISKLSGPKIERKQKDGFSGHVRPLQGAEIEICNFGAPSPLDFLNFLPWIFFLFLHVYLVAPSTG